MTRRTPRPGSGRFLRRRDVRRSRISVARVVLRAVATAALVLGAGWLAIAARSVALTSPLFAVRDVRVDGVRYDDAEAIDALVEPVLGANLFRADVAALAERVRARPWVAAARVARRPPDTLLLRVEERAPTAVARVEGALVLIDPEGRPIVPAPAALRGVAPILEGAGDPVGRRGRLRRGIAVLDALARTSSELLADVAAIDVGRRDRVRLQMREGGPELYLPVHDPYRNLDRYAVLRGPLGRAYHDAAYVDLRWRDRIVLGPRS